MDWNEGYVIDVDYTHGFYSDLAPRALAFVAWALGVEAPDVDDSFNYCELGCGQGLSTNVFAAVNPQGNFFANDFNPTHVRHAVQLAEKAGISNVRFLENSIEELVEMDLPPMDFVTMHGVYSWVSDGARRAIVEFIRRKLKPGGLVYISYNCMPGWASMLPAQRILTECAAMSQGSSDVKFKKALDYVVKLSEKGAKYFQEHPTIKARLADMQKKSVHYLLHEYMNRYWYIPYHADVVREMEDAKLTYLGTCDLFRQFDEFCVPADIIPLLDEVADPIRRETIRDIVTNKQFRKDIYGRGRSPLKQQARVERLRKMRLALARAVPAEKLEFKLPLGTLTFEYKVYRPLLEALKDGPRRVEDLMSIPEIAKLTVGQLRQAVMIFVSAGLLVPAAEEETTRAASPSANRFNAAMLDRFRQTEDSALLVSPVTGSGTTVNLMEGMWLAARSRGEANPPRTIINWMTQQGRQLLIDNKAPESPDDLLNKLAQFGEQVEKQRLPVLRALGVDLLPKSRARKA